jgi:hypothetical protein
MTTVTSTAENLPDLLRQSLREELYEKYYNVFGYLLADETYRELLEQDVELLAKEREARMQDVLQNTRDGTNQQLFLDYENHEEKEEEEKNESDEEKENEENRILAEMCAEDILNETDFVQM